MRFCTVYIIIVDILYKGHHISSPYIISLYVDFGPKKRQVDAKVAGLVSQRLNSRLSRTATGYNAMLNPAQGQPLSEILLQEQRANQQRMSSLAPSWGSLRELVGVLPGQRCHKR